MYLAEELATTITMNPITKHLNSVELEGWGPLAKEADQPEAWTDVAMDSGDVAHHFWANTKEKVSLLYMY